MIRRHLAAASTAVALVATALAAGPASAATADTTLNFHGVCVQDYFEPYFLVQNTDGRWEEFWVGTDHQLWHYWQLTPGGNYGPMVSLGGYLTSCVDWEYNPDGRIEVFGRGPGGDLQHIWQDPTSPNGWSAWASLGGSVTSADVPNAVYAYIVSLGRIEVRILGGDNLYHYKWQDPTSPNGWSAWY